MRISPTFAIAAAAALLGVLAPSAMAASPSTIYKDAADGSIDGNYSLSDLRAADAGIPADQREYYFWDELYQAAVSAIANPSAPKPPKLTIVKPKDTNGNGSIDATEVTEATKKTKTLNKAKLAELEKIEPIDPATIDDEADSDDTAIAAASDDKPDDGSDDSSYGLLIALAALLIAPLLVVGGRTLWTRRQAKHADKPFVDPAIAPPLKGRAGRKNAKRDRNRRGDSA